MRDRLRSSILALSLFVLPALLLTELSACRSSRPPAQDERDETRSFVILSINDLYRAEGFLETDEAGLARVRELRRRLEEDHSILLLHAGDFIYPSLLSREFDGEQMIAAMNLLDGKLGFDDRMAVVFGNHEFDKKKWKDVDLLQARLNESHFDWLGANVRFLKHGDKGIRSERIAPNRVFQIGGVKVGVYGLTKAVADVEYAEFAGSPSELIAESEKQILELRNNHQAEVVIALTHLGASTDRMILEHEVAPDILIGGHDHSMIRDSVDGRYLLKAASDGRGAWTTTVTMDRTGRPHFVPVHRDLRKSDVDRELQAITRVWVRLHEEIYCRKKNLPRGCLSDRFATATTEIIGEELAVRSRSTNLGNFVADRMVLGAQSADTSRFKDAIAFTNSGSIRLNRDIPRGGPFTRRALAEALQYPSELFFKEIPGRVLQQALDHSVACRESGPWLQVSENMRFRADLQSAKAVDVRINGAALDTSKQYLVVTNGFLAGVAPGDRDKYDLGDGWKSTRTIDSTAPDLEEAICSGLGGCKNQSNPPGLQLDQTERVQLPPSAGLKGGASPACGVDN